MPKDETIYTPVEEHGGHLVKRDDLADEQGVLGGKARTLGVVCRHVLRSGRKGITICASRNSVTPATLGAVCRAYDVQACVHTSAAAQPSSPAYQQAVADGVVVMEHRPGYMSVLEARARLQASEDDYLLLGLGLDFPPAVKETAKQCRSLVGQPFDRLVVSVGSGHMLEGIVKGLNDFCLRPPVLGVCVGKKPSIYYPPWVKLIQSPLSFHKPAQNNRLGDLKLNPYYEAKCLPYLQTGDLLWVIAK